MTTKRFGDSGCYTDQDVEAALRRNDASELLHVAIAVGLGHPNLSWAENVSLQLAAHDDPTVRGNAVLALGHLARRFGALSDAARARVQEALQDPDPHVHGHALSAADDIETFLTGV